MNFSFSRKKSKSPAEDARERELKLQQEQSARHAAEYEEFIKSPWVQDAAKGLISDAARRRKKKKPEQP